MACTCRILAIVHFSREKKMHNGNWAPNQPWERERKGQIVVAHIWKRGGRFEKLVTRFVRPSQGESATKSIYAHPFVGQMKNDADKNIKAGAGCPLRWSNPYHMPHRARGHLAGARGHNCTNSHNHFCVRTIYAYSFIMHTQFNGDAYPRWADGKRIKAPSARRGGTAMHKAKTESSHEISIERERE